MTVPGNLFEDLSDVKKDTTPSQQPVGELFSDLIPKEEPKLTASEFEKQYGVKPVVRVSEENKPRTLNEWEHYIRGYGFTVTPSRQPEIRPVRPFILGKKSTVTELGGAIGNTLKQGYDEGFINTGDPIGAAGYSVAKFVANGITGMFSDVVKGGQAFLQDFTDRDVEGVISQANEGVPVQFKQAANDFYKQELSLLTPFEAEEARRGFVAIGAGLVVGAGAGSFAYRMSSGLGRVAQIGLTSQAAAISGATVQGLLEKNDNTRGNIERAAAYTLAAIPLGLATDYLMAGLVKTPNPKTFGSSDNLAAVKSVRAFDESPATPSTLRQKIANVIFPEGEAERRALLRKTEIDSKTGLGSAEAWEKARVSAEADPGSSILVIDGDNFGQINKQHGFQLGDKAIVDIAESLKEVGKEWGVEGRIFRPGGGDEFVIIAPNDVLQGLQDAVTKAFGKRKYGNVEVSLSVGEGNTFEIADAQMQKIKQGKKKQIIDVNNPEKMETPDAAAVKINPDIVQETIPTPPSQTQIDLSAEKVSASDIAKNDLIESLVTLHAVRSLNKAEQGIVKIAAEQGIKDAGSGVKNNPFAKGSKGFLAYERGHSGGVVDDVVKELTSDTNGFNGVTVVPGVTNPEVVLNAVRAKLPENHVVSIHKRADGLHDVAIGSRKSKLAGSQAQFSKYGYYEGQPVYIDGADYYYKSQLNDTESLVFEVGPKGPEKPFKVTTANLRRAADQVEVLARDYPLDELKDILDPESFDAIKDIINNRELRLNPTPKDQALSNNMKIERGPAGSWHVVDGYTGKVQGRGFRTEADASAWVNSTQQAGGPPIVTPSDVDNIASLIPPDGDHSPIELMMVPQRGKITELLSKMDNGLTRVVKFMHLAFDRFQALDNRYPGLNITQVHNVVDKLHPAVMRNIHTWVDRLKSVERIAVKGGMDLNTRKLIGEYIETASATELEKVIGPESLQYGKDLAALGKNVSTKRIYDFIRRRNYDIEELRSTNPNITSVDIDNISKNIQKQMLMSQEEVAGVDIIEQAKTDPLADVDVVTRYANAVWDETLDRKSFAKHHKFTPQMLKVADDMIKLYDEAAEYLGIDKLKYYGYLQHARSHAMGDDLGSAFFGTPNLEKDFISELYRTGEVGGYNLDPITNFANYIYQGVMKKEFMPAFNNAVKDVEYNMKRLGLDKEGSEPAIHLNGYKRDVLSLPSLDNTVLDDAVTRAMQHMPYFKGKSFSVIQDVISPMLNYMTANMQGARLGMAIRDYFGDLVPNYYYKYDAKSTLRMMKLGGNPENVAAMKAKGVVTSLDRLDIETADQSAVGGAVRPQAGLIKKGVRAYTELALKTSGQPTVYEMAQTGIYMETMERASEGLQKLSSSDGFKGKNKVYQKIGVFKHDTPVREQFDKLVSQSKFEEAADYLARITIYDQMGRYGMGNNAYGQRSIFGRLGLHLGTWSMQKKGFISRGMLVGTRADRLGFVARMAAGESAKVAVGAMTGLNMRSWYLLAGVPFAGGPLFQLMQMGVQAQTGTELDKEMFLSRLSRTLPGNGNMRSMFIPFSFAYNDLYQMATDRNIDNPAKVVGRAAGIPVGETNPLQAVPGLQTGIGIGKKIVGAVDEMTR